MGTGAGTGLNFGHTKGNQFIELEAAGVKFTKEDVLFVTKDKTGQLVWLEKGNQRAGLEHILNGSGNTGGHAADFERAFGLSKAQIPAFLEKVISKGKIVSTITKLVNGKPGFERIYEYDGKHFVLAGIGTNGFIVSAYPISN